MWKQEMSVTNVIVGITCLVSVLALRFPAGKALLIFHPVTMREQQQWYRLLTSGFIHGDFLHLAINMFVLWSFGNVIESYYATGIVGAYGTQKFMALYFGGIIVSSIPSYIRHKRDPRYAALGASGGVAAVVFAAILFEPWQNLYLYGVIAIPQIVAGAAYLYYSWYKDKQANDNVGHMAHFAGAIWGFVFTGLLNLGLFAHFLHQTLQGPRWL
jgi:membrane associated rhomboid family serine protease